MSKVIEVVERDELADLLDTEDVLVVDFTAPAWCGPCQKFAPHFAAAAERSEVTFVSVDIDKSDWAVLDYGIKSVPTVKVFKDSTFITDIAKTPATRNAPKFLDELHSVL